jgi:hypothetical protein
MAADYSIILGLAVIVILGGLMFLFMSKFSVKKCRTHLNVDEYRVKFLAAENQLKHDDQGSYSLSVLNADKLVDQALRELGLPGETMGEKLKNSPKKFSDINSLWLAHKLRNRIAHETNVVVGYDEARYALASFKKALKDLGAI